MSDNYTKLACDIIHSSIWCQPDDGLCKLWVTLLAMADRDGVVNASDIGIARSVGHTVEVTRANLELLQAPDPDSKNPANDGRRIKPLPQGGYRLLNFEVYRDRSSPDERAAKNAARQRRYRERKASQGPTDQPAASSPTTEPTVANQAKSMEANRTLVPCIACGQPWRKISGPNGPFYGHGKQGGPTGCRATCPESEYQDRVAASKPHQDEDF